MMKPLVCLALIIQLTVSPAYSLTRTVLGLYGGTPELKSSTEADRNTDDYLDWLGLSVGYGAIWNGNTMIEGIALGGLITSHLSENVILSGRYMQCFEFVLFSHPGYQAADIGLLLGYSLDHNSYSANLSGGIGFGWGVTRGEKLNSSGWFNATYETLRYSQMTFPIHAQFFWMLSDSFGLGVDGFTSIASTHWFAGGSASVKFLF